MDRRNFLEIAIGVSASAVFSPVAAAAGVAAARGAPADLSRPAPGAREARLLWARLLGDLSGRTVIFYTHGTVWGFKPQADDLTIEQFARRVYGYSSVSARKFEKQADGTYRLHQKSWAFYRDPISDEITDKIPNPYTGVVDTAAPMSGKASAQVFDPSADAGGAMPFNMRIRRFGKSGIVETSAFHRINPGGIPWYKLEANLEDYVCAGADLDAPDCTHVSSRFSQNVIAEWQTWTKMHGMPGHILFKGNGEPLYHLDALPADQIAAIDRFFPGTIAEVSAWG